MLWAGDLEVRGSNLTGGGLIFFSIIFIMDSMNDSILTLIFGFSIKNDITSGNICKNCRVRTGPTCVYCRIPVKGHVTACLACGHGGHLNHMMEWFRNNHRCAAACGCNCLSEMEEFNYIPIGGDIYTGNM